MQIFTNPMLHARFLLVQRQVREAKLHQPLQTGFYGDCILLLLETNQPVIFNLGWIFL